MGTRTLEVTSMKILIVNNMAPFIWGGAEELAVNLNKQLILAGHESEILRIPFQYESLTKIPSQMLMVKAFELWNVDHVIAFKFPAYLIRHPKKTLWLLHQYRQVYDLYDENHANTINNTIATDVRQLIINADNACFKECNNIYCNSEVTQERLLKYNGFNSKILRPPVNDPGYFLDGSYGDYIFAGGRINSMKRQHLLIEALQYTPSHVKLLIAGPPDTPEDAIRLEKMVEELNLKERVTLDLRFLPRDTYANYMKHAAAAAYLPYDEDSLGYIAMEAAIAEKAIITTIDSGGILGLAKNGETGWVTIPEAQDLAAALTAVWHDKTKTEILGQAANTLYQSFNITWQHTIETLLS